MEPSTDKPVPTWDELADRARKMQIRVTSQEKGQIRPSLRLVASR